MALTVIESRFPSTLVNVASILTVPGVLRAEEASTIPVSEVGNCSAAVHQKDIRRDVDIAPWATEGLARIWLLSRTMSFESIAMLPPLPTPLPNARGNLAVGQMHE